MPFEGYELKNEALVYIGLLFKERILINHSIGPQKQFMASNNHSVLIQFF
jgi:hypothetical protein